METFLDAILKFYYHNVNLTKNLSVFNRLIIKICRALIRFIIDILTLSTVAIDLSKYD